MNEKLIEKIYNTWSERANFDTRWETETDKSKQRWRDFLLVLVEVLLLTPRDKWE